MKKFMQVLLGSFAVMSLVFAGCNTKTTEEIDVTVPADESTETTVTPVDGGTVEVETTTTTTAQ